MDIEPQLERDGYAERGRIQCGGGDDGSDANACTVEAAKEASAARAAITTARGRTYLLRGVSRAHVDAFVAAVVHAQQQLAGGAATLRRPSLVVRDEAEAEARAARARSEAAAAEARAMAARLSEARTRADRASSAPRVGGLIVSGIARSTDQSIDRSRVAL